MSYQKTFPKEEQAIYLENLKLLHELHLNASKKRTMGPWPTLINTYIGFNDKNLIYSNCDNLPKSPIDLFSKWFKEPCSYRNHIFESDPIFIT